MTDRREVLLHGSLLRQKQRGSAFMPSWIRRYFSVEKVLIMSRYGSKTLFRLCYFNAKVEDATQLLSLKPKYWTPLDEIISVRSIGADRMFTIRSYTRNFTLKAETVAARNCWIVGLIKLCGLKPDDNDADLGWPYDSARPCPSQVIFGGTINETISQERRVSQERMHISSDSSEGESQQP